MKMKILLPWLLAAAFAAALVFVSLARRQTTPAPKDQVTQDSSGRRVTAWIDPMYSQGPPHLYRSNHPGVAPDCGMKLVPVYADDATAPATGTAPAVTGYSEVSIPEGRRQLIGVKLATATMRDLSRSTRTTGRIAIDERLKAQVRSKTEGFIDALYVNFTGQPVRRGDPLLALYSPDLLATQNELILASRDHSELGRTLAGAARARLGLWDMSSADIDRVVRTGKAVRDVVVRSPLSGVVMSKTAVAGGRVMPGDALYEIADLSHLWLLADVYESELPSMRVGTAAEVIAGGQTFPGRVAFVSPVLTPETRSATVRIEVDNTSGLLKPDMYADVVLRQTAGTHVAVPDSAVMNTGTRSVIFVALPDGSFDPRQVKTGARADGYYEIISGVTAGERVVVDANFLVDSESRLKAALSQMK